MKLQNKELPELDYASVCPKKFRIKDIHPARSCFIFGFTHQMIECKARPCLSIFTGCKDYHITLIPFMSNGSWSYGILKNKPNGKTTIIDSYNKFPRWFKSIEWKILERELKNKGLGSTICQGCGEGISKWRIKDPNKPFDTRKYFNCCDGCVNFYDLHWSQKKILRWKRVLRKKRFVMKPVCGGHEIMQSKTNNDSKNVLKKAGKRCKPWAKSGWADKEKK